jgi:hypothetical protein
MGSVAGTCAAPEPGYRAGAIRRILAAVGLGPRCGRGVADRAVIPGQPGGARTAWPVPLQNSMQGL